MTKIRIYVAAAITGASPEFIDMVQRIVLVLEQQEWIEVLRFVLNPNATPEEIVENDIDRGIATCTFVLAILDERSTGMGMELSIARYLFGKPVCGVYMKSTAKIVTGLLHRWEHEVPHRYSIQHYQSDEHLVNVIVSQFVSNLDTIDPSQLKLGA